MNAVSNIKQSQRLLKLLGSDSTADFWRTPKVGGYVVSTEKSANSTPAWSATAIMEQLDEVYDEEYGTACPYISCTEDSVYFDAHGFVFKEFSDGATLIDNLIDALEWQIKHPCE